MARPRGVAYASHGPILGPVRDHDNNPGSQRGDMTMERGLVGSAGRLASGAMMNTLRAVVDHVPAEIAELATEIEALEQRLVAARARKARLEELLAVAERPLGVPEPKLGIKLIASARFEPADGEGTDVGRRARG